MLLLCTFPFIGELSRGMLGLLLADIAQSLNESTVVVDMSYKISVVIEKDDDGYYAYCPELEGCQSEGDTLEEVMANIKEAADLYLETLTADEIRQRLSRDILTTSIEVQVA